MGIEFDYVQTSELYDHLGLTEGKHEGIIERALSAAHEDIDTYCGRRFIKDETLTARTFKALSPGLCRIRDAIDIGLIETSTSGRAGTFVTFLADDVIEHKALGDLTFLDSPVEMIGSDCAAFPRGARCWIRVTPTTGWGWEKVPHAVKKATILQAAKLFIRKDSPGGSLAGFQAAGFALKGADLGLDKDAEHALAGGYVRSEKMIG